jgi:3-hydroxy acid dehydrogenase/malonic semialdehyde reductase
VGGTEFSSVRFGGDEAKAAAVYAGTTPLTAEDVADTIYLGRDAAGARQRQLIQLMPVCQAFGPLAVKRDEAPARG